MRLFYAKYIPRPFNSLNFHLFHCQTITFTVSSSLPSISSSTFCNLALPPNPTSCREPAFSPTESESEVGQFCLTLCDHMDCSLPGSSIHGIFQARGLEWVATSFSRGSSRPRDRTRVPALQADALPSEPPGKPFLPSNLVIIKDNGYFSVFISIS